MFDGSVLEPSCSASEAYCNGASPAGNGNISDDHSMLGKPVDDSSNNSKVVDDNDVYAELGEKESNLELAAQLGKALLQQNEELRWTNERMIQEFNQKIEVHLSDFGHFS